MLEINRLGVDLYMSCSKFFKGCRDLLHLEWISNEVLLYSTRSYNQSLGIEHDGRSCEKKKKYEKKIEWVTVLYSRNRYNTVNQLYLNGKKRNFRKASKHGKIGRKYVKILPAVSFL